MYYIIFMLIAYILGVITSIYYSINTILIALAVYAVISIIVSRKIIINILIILFFILAYLSFNYNSNSQLLQYINQDVNITAKVVDIRSNDESSNYIGYNVVITDVNNDKLNEKSILYLKKENEIPINSIVSLNAKTSDITSTKNHMLFNYKNYLNDNGIFVTFFANNSATILQENYSIFNTIANTVIIKIESIFTDNMSEDNANILLSIILGNTDYLDDNLYKNIQNTGLAHIFAVSGLHIGIIYTYLIKILCFVGVGRKKAWCISWGILWMYGFLIGFPISVLRGLVMFTFLFGSQLLYRKYSSLNSLVASALLLLIFNPRFLFQVGFLLSYGAALSLLLFNKLTADIKCNKLLKGIYLYIFIQIFTLPIISYYFNYISLIGLIFNIVLVPVFSWIVVIAFSIVPIGSIFGALIFYPLKLMDYLLNTIAFSINIGGSFEFSGLKIESMSLEIILFFYVFLFIMLFLTYKKRGYSNKYYTDNRKYSKILLLIFSAFYIGNLMIIPMIFNGLRINIVDVGQGLFIAIKNGGINIIVDAGSNSDDIGEYVVAPYLKKNGYYKVDSIFISHYHKDHINGINSIIENAKVKSVYASSEDIEKDIEYNLQVLKAQKKITIGKNLVMKLLWPDEKYFSENKNNMSFVFLMEYNGKKILLANDIEEEVEKIILNRLESVDVVVVPHHGSKSSSSQEFVDKIKPKVAVFSYGKNMYKIPNEGVIKRYEACDTTILSTYYDGEINFMVIGDEIYYNTYEGKCSSNWNKYYNFKSKMNVMLAVVCGLMLFTQAIKKQMYCERLQ